MSCASPALAVDLSGELGLISDYRYRGVSLSHGHPAIQGTLTLEHDSGLYAELWSSTLGEGSLAKSEIDLTGGYEKNLSEHFSFDVAGTYYAYPSDGSGNTFEATAVGTTTHGNGLASFGLSYAPGQRATGGKDNIYLFGEAEYAVPKTELTIKAMLGHERGAFDEVGHRGKWDWSLGAEFEAAPATFGLTYVGSNADEGDRQALIGSLFLKW